MKSHIKMLLIALLTISAMASENNSTKVDETIQSSNTGLRVGFLSGSTSDEIKTSTSTIKSTKDGSEGGLSLSFYAQEFTNDGEFGARPVLTLNIANSELEESGEKFKVSSVVFLGEFEFFYQVNKSFVPFIGLNGGLGSSKFTVSNQFDSFSDRGLTAELGVFIGVNGQISNNIGYFAKLIGSLRSTAIRDSNEFVDLNVNQSLSRLNAGIEFRF